MGCTACFLCELAASQADTLNKDMLQEKCEGLIRGTVSDMGLLSTICVSWLQAQVTR
jgi:multimeric flavodoxin WrbA